MISEQQLQVMEQGAPHEVAVLCAEVRRLYEGIQNIIAAYDGRDHVAPLLELRGLLKGEAA